MSVGDPFVSGVRCHSEPHRSCTAQGELSGRALAYRSNGVNISLD